MNRAWFVLPLLVFATALFSQAQPPDPLRFEHLSISQGLANNVVYAMLQDRRGYLWFATDNGLSRYDGYTFTTYKTTPGDTTSLVGNAVIHLMECREGYIWIGMMGQGMCRFDPKTEQFTHYGPDPLTLNQGTVDTIVEDREGYLWVSNGVAELRRFDKRTGTYSRINYATRLVGPSAGGKRPTVHTLYRDKTGTIWVGSQYGLHRMHQPAGQPDQVRFTSYEHQDVLTVVEDQTGMLWVGSWQGLNRFDPKTATFTRYDPRSGSEPYVFTKRNVIHLDTDPAGNLWIATNNAGLVQFNPERTRFTRFLHDPDTPPSLHGNFVRTLLVDRSGLLWVSIWGEGVDKANLRQQPFQHFRSIPGRPTALNGQYVDAILEDRSGVLWVGTGYGLNRLDRQTGRFTFYAYHNTDPKKGPDGPIHALLEDRAGNLWVASKGELLLFDRQTGTFTTLTQDSVRYPGLGGNEHLFTLYEDRRGRLWLGTGNGVKCFDYPARKVVHYRYDPQNPKGISDAWALSIREDNRGNLWIGTGSVALNRLDLRTHQFTHYRPNRRQPGSITADAVPCILLDSKGNLWLATSSGGLCRFDYEQNRFQAFTQADGLADNSIFSLEEDTRGNLWLGTSKGLSRFSFKSRTFTNYAVQDGLPGSGFGRAHTRGRDGQLYFGSDAGMIAFDPDRLTINRHVPPVVITQVNVFDRLRPGQQNRDTLVLNYNENFLSFDFAALDYANPDRNQYAYQLVGLEKDWVMSGSRRNATYTDLDPGTYLFRVKGSNNDGIWNNRGVSMHLIIRPPWWKTTWFQVASGLMLLLGAFFGGRFYIQQRLRRQRQEIKRVLQAQEEERQRLAADLHDDLGATLVAIKMQLEAIHEPDDELSRPIELMGKALKDLRHIAHNLMPPEFAQLGLTGALRQTVRQVRGNSNLDFQFYTEGTERRLDHETELTIYRIAVELIQNALKHAKARQIVIKLIFHPQQVFLLVEDDGKGYPTTRPAGSSGIGLRNIRSRAAYLKSKLVVDSGETGTTVTLEVPI